MRVPIGKLGEFGTLNSAINGGVVVNDSGLRNNWLVQYAGYWEAGFYEAGTRARHWSSSQFTSSGLAYSTFIHSGNVSMSNANGKGNGFTVRCIAN